MSVDDEAGTMRVSNVHPDKKVPPSYRMVNTVKTAKWRESYCKLSKVR